MQKNLPAARLTWLVNRAIIAFVILLLPGLPFLLRWYCTLRDMPKDTFYVLLVAFYCCAVFILSALHAIDCLLGNILDMQVFVAPNSRYLRRIRRCCGMISLICLPASFIYLPLWLIVIIMAFLYLVIRVVAQVMDAAIAIREENDLTI